MSNNDEILESRIEDNIDKEILKQKNIIKQLEMERDILDLTMLVSHISCVGFGTISGLTVGLIIPGFYGEIYDISSILSSFSLGFATGNFIGIRINHNRDVELDKLRQELKQEKQKLQELYNEQEKIKVEQKTKVDNSKNKSSDLERKKELCSTLKEKMNKYNTLLINELEESKDYNQEDTEIVKNVIEEENQKILSYIEPNQRK